MKKEKDVFETPPPKEIITEEQRVRISQKFRAAKALLSRKRPFESTTTTPSPSFPHRYHPKNDDQNKNIHRRRPLGELQVNTPSPVAVKAPYLTNRHSIRSCPGRVVSIENGGIRVNYGGEVRVEGSKESDDGFGLLASSTITPVKQFGYTSNLNGKGVNYGGGEVRVEGSKKSDDGFGLLASSTITPVKQFDCTSNLNEAFSSSPISSFLDDDFDDAILQEIDALCELKSAVKMGLAENSSKGLIKVEAESNILKEIDAVCEQSSSIQTKKQGGSSEDSSMELEGLLEVEAQGHILKELDVLCEQRSAGEKQVGSSEDSSTIEVEAEGHILKAIDVLCEKKPAIKVEKQSALSEDSSVEFDKLLDTQSIQDIKRDEPETKVESTSTSQAMRIQSLPKASMEYMQALNDQQKEAACSDISTPLMIIAGPGSGKTSTMVGRVLMLLNEGIGPSNILAMTFTTAAASEMRDRIGAVAGKSAAKELMISTFHSFCLQLCRSHAEKLERTPEFLIYGHGQQRRAIIEAVRLLEIGQKDRQNADADKLDKDSINMNSAEYLKDKSKKWQKFVTQAKASGKTPSECKKMGDEIGAAVLGNYDGILKTCNALDYHDLISCSVKLLTDFPGVYEECQGLWKAIVIDEFQDTSSMQYNFLRILASHNRITIVGDEDQSIFSFNGADVSGFDSFRKDFPNHKEIRLTKNYRSTRCIVDAASSLIHNNVKRCPLKQVFTDNSCGSKITVKECYKEDAQCAFVVDKIWEIRSDTSDVKFSFGNVAVLYRRQISGKVFQTAFRDRKIPFNVHGVAFYRKKVVKAIFAMLRTTLPGCDDGSFRQVFKAFLPCEKEEKKRVVDHIDKIATTRKSSFISAACDIFAAKVSGTFKRNQLTQGRKVLSTLDMISKLVHREQSISTVITSVANMLPQKYLLEQRAVANVDSGKLLNEDNDLRSVLQYLLDDVTDFLSSHFSHKESGEHSNTEEKGCAGVLKVFIDYISTRESENFRSRKRDNGDSVTLTTIHQSKGLEWDTVFIIKANESEIPLLHEYNGVIKESGTSLEEERRLLYVAMTRARKKLYILYVTMDSNWQLLQPSRFLKEIPRHLLDVQGEMSREVVKNIPEDLSGETDQYADAAPKTEQVIRENSVQTSVPKIPIDDVVRNESIELVEAHNGNSFLKRFDVEDRSIVSHIFHQWAKKKAFKDPKRLLDKIGFVIDERLRIKVNKHKDVLRSLKSCLKDDDAFGYAEYVLMWEKIPADQRAHIMREKQEHFLKLRIENAMGSSEATPKQISYLQSLGCTVVPTSRLHASRLIEQYKSL